MLVIKVPRDRELSVCLLKIFKNSVSLKCQCIVPVYYENNIMLYLFIFSKKPVKTKLHNSLQYTPTPSKHMSKNKICMSTVDCRTPYKEAYLMMTDFPLNLF